MKTIHDIHEDNSLVLCRMTDDILYQAVGSWNRMNGEKNPAILKEITMYVNGHINEWRAHSGIGHAKATKRWYEQLRDWWTAHKAARREANLASLHACWDAKREAVRAFRAEAAPEMAAARHAFSVATMLYGLSQ
jgi:hypothetical protein